MAKQAVTPTYEPVIHKTVSIYDLIPHEANYNEHPQEQLNDLKASLRRFGQVEDVVVKALPEGKYKIAAHEGVTTAALQLLEAGECPYLADWNITIVPGHWTDLDVKGYMAASNELTRKSNPDQEILAQLLEEQKNAGYPLESVGSDDEALRQMLDALADEALGFNGEVERPEKGKQPNPRVLPFDMIYTWNNPDATCCLACQAGLKYGVQSTKRDPCPNRTRWREKHALTFIDNNYFDYNHAFHLAFVQEYRPKYATVMDVMTKAQCSKDAITYTPLEQILDWAEELSEYTDNVIVIPKYDCLDKIPEKFMLGYSVPSSHGGTPLPIGLFRGRRVHLLGGSWKSQLSYMAELGDDVVSADNNQINLIAAKWGQFVLPDGETMNLTEVGHGNLNNPRYAALALSFGSIGTKVRELYAKGLPVEEEPEEIDWSIRGLQEMDNE